MAAHGAHDTDELAGNAGAIRCAPQATDAVAQGKHEEEAQAMTYAKARRILFELLTATHEPMSADLAEETLDALSVTEMIDATRDKRTAIATARGLKTFVATPR
jgi:hypothetical protein